MIAAYPLLSNASHSLEMLRVSAFRRDITVLLADTPDICCRHAPAARLWLGKSYTIRTATRHINVGHRDTDRWVAQFTFAKLAFEQNAMSNFRGWPRTVYHPNLNTVEATHFKHQAACHQAAGQCHQTAGQCQRRNKLSATT
jgi:hypothetical protein